MLVLKPAEALHDQVDAAVRILRGGGVVAIPTDTLYGLAACAPDEAAIERVFHLKGRSKGMALPLLLADAHDISIWAGDIPRVAWDLARHFWPGALTLVLKRGDDLPDAVCGGMDTVGLRVPDNQVPRSIARALGAPITGTSANRSGGPGLTTAKAVRAEFGDEIDMVVDGGETPEGSPSTVLDLSKGPPRILRPGSVSPRDIEAVCGLTVVT